MRVSAVLATVLPMAFYLYVALRRDSRARSDDEYFIYAQEVSAADYANTSVGYALQMAAVFLFAYWGATYGLGALWTVIFWGIGFYLLLRILPRFLSFHAYKTTMHAYVADRSKAGHTLQGLAAAATIFGLLGTMMAEIDYTVQVYSPVVRSKSGMLLVGGIFLLFGLAYIIISGYKAEVLTERFQVPIAYMGIIVVLVLVWCPINNYTK